MAKVTLTTCDIHTDDYTRRTKGYRLGLQGGELRNVELCAECAEPVAKILKALKPNPKGKAKTTVQAIEQSVTEGTRPVRSRAGASRAN